MLAFLHISYEEATPPDDAAASKIVYMKKGDTNSPNLKIIRQTASVVLYWRQK